MKNLQLKSQSGDTQYEDAEVTLRQLERRIIILSSLCNSVFARPVDFTNLSEAKIQYAASLKSIQKPALDTKDWIKFEVVK